MKRIIMFLAAAVAVLGCSDGAAGEQALLSIHVENPTAREVVLVYHGQMKSVALDESGTAQMDLSEFDVQLDLSDQ